MVPSAGLLAKAGKYLEALDAPSIQYFVAFDNQGQRSLARSVRDGYLDYQTRTASLATQLQATVASWLAEVRGDNGTRSSLIAIGYGAVYIAGFCLVVLLGCVAVSPCVTIFALETNDNFRWAGFIGRSLL